MTCVNHPACCRQVDSGFRRAATGILPSHRIQDILSINDGGAVGMATNPFRPPLSFQRRLESTPTGMYACMDAGGRAAPACCRQVGNRPPRKAGREVQGWQGLADGASGCRACCHSRFAGAELAERLDSGSHAPAVARLTDNRPELPQKPAHECADDTANQHAYSCPKYFVYLRNRSAKQNIPG